MADELLHVLLEAGWDARDVEETCLPLFEVVPLVSLSIVSRFLTGGRNEGPMASRFAGRAGAGRPIDGLGNLRPGRAPARPCALGGRKV
jgi:hypothetical protein